MAFRKLAVLAVLAIAALVPERAASGQDGGAAPHPATPVPRRLPPVTQIPHIPAEAREMLPAGCLEAWDQPHSNGQVAEVDAGHAAALAMPQARPNQQPSNPQAAVPPASLQPASLQPASLQPAIDRRAALQQALLASQRSAPVTPWAPHAVGAAGPVAEMPADQSLAPGEDPHLAIFLESEYPSALTCAKCHPRQFEEWRVSAHAYATISPMFQRFEQKMTELSQGTVGSFCYRCHAPVAVQAEIPRFASILDAPPIVREGITCVACHRVVEQYGKTNGRRRVEPGDIFQPVTSGGDGSGLAQAVADAERLKIKTHPSDTGPGQPIHERVITFEPITRSDFCLSCHQVAVHPGIWLEVVYAQYNAGPARAKGITCQDCHMGSVPGKPDGYECIPIAELADKPYGQPKKHANHMFWGPGYSIAHPGLFPMSEKAERWSPRDWLRFDWQAGWGTEAFERSDAALDDSRFPPPWNNTDERRDARRVLDANLKSLEIERAGSIAAMEAGSRIEGPLLRGEPRVGHPLRLEYIVHNVSEGHNLPTGSLGAQPQVWLNVALVDPLGRTVWESGYLDTQGDLADMNSVDVATGRVPRDAQLFNLQTKFLITNVKGTDRELPLPVNVDIDQIPFLRPATVPVSVLNHPPFIRMEAHSIPPLDHRRVKYKVPAERIHMPGTYRLDVRMRSRVEPPYFMRFVGSTPEMINRMNHQILDIHPRSFHFDVYPSN